MALSIIITSGLGLWWISFILACLTRVDGAPKNCPGSQYYLDKHTGRRECCDEICRYAAVTGFQEECDNNCPGYAEPLSRGAQVEPVPRPEPVLGDSGGTDHQGRATTIAITVAALFLAVAVAVSAVVLYRYRHRLRLPRVLTLAITTASDIHAATDSPEDEEERRPIQAQSDSHHRPPVPETEQNAAVSQFAGLLPTQL